MLNRRLIRIKVFQFLYAHFLSETPAVVTTMNNLMKTFQRMHELFILNLALLIKVAEALEELFEVAQQKFYKDELDSPDLRRLIHNVGIQNLIENPSLKQYVQQYKLQLSDAMDLVRHLAKIIEKHPLYIEYRKTTDNQNDLEHLKKIYRKIICKDENFLSYLEDKNLHWKHDQYYVSIIVKTYMNHESFFHNPHISVPDVFKEKELEESESDEEFARKLLRETIVNAEEYQNIIQKYSENWDTDRITLTDMILMQMACTEFLYFDQIPTKVTLNEYIEISKIYSTPKSKIFINGILDKVLAHYNREGKVVKIGLGLQE